MRRTRCVAAAAALLALVVGTLACAPRGEGVLAGAADLRGARIVVGGGPGDELAVLCQLTVAAVEAAGGTPSDQCARYGALDAALPPERSFVEVGWAYPGRADRDLDGRPDPPATPEQLARTDPRLAWLAPTAFSAGEAVVVTPGVAAAGVRTVSDLARRPGAWCVPPGPDATRLLAAYRPDAARVADAPAALAEVARGGCTAAVVPNTSGRIPALGLVVLVDDRGVLPRTGATPVVRRAVLDRHPGIRAVLEVLTTRLSDDVMRGLNREVGQSGRDPRDVARTWLRDQDLT